MKTIHHAVAKKAAKAQVELTANEDGTFTAKDLTTNTVTSGDNATKLLADVLAARPKAEKPARQPKAAKKPKAKKSKKTDDEDGEEAEGEDGEEGDEPVSGSIVKSKYKKKYAPHHDSCGDDLAEAMAAYTTNDDGDLDLGKLAKVAKDNGFSIAKYAALNNGQKRMNVSNVLRGMRRRGTDVVIGDKTLKGAKVEKTEGRKAASPKEAK